MMRWFHIALVGAGFLSLSTYQAWDLFKLGHAFNASGYGMALGALAGGYGIGMGVLAGASNFLGSGGGNITEG